MIELIRALVKFAEKLPSKFLPGVVLLFAGLVVIGIAAASDNGSSGNSDSTTTTIAVTSTTTR